MHNPSVYSPRARCQLSIAIEVSSWSASEMHRFALRLPRRSLQSIDRPAPETSLPSAAASELKMSRLARFVQLESNGSRARSLKLDASSSGLSGAALSVVPGQSGIVRSRIAACDVDGPLQLLVRDDAERLGLLIYHLILAMDRLHIPESGTVSCAHSLCFPPVVYTCTKDSLPETCLQVQASAL